MINGFLKTIASLLMLCTVVSFASCRNDGDDEELGGGTTGQPPVITFDNGTATINTEICADLGYDYDDISAKIAPYCTKVQSIVTAESFDDIG